MKKLLLAVFILLFSQYLFGQKVRELGMTPKWSDGKVTLKNNEVYKGELYYNTNSGTIQFKSNDTDELISWHEDRIQSLSFFDKDLKKVRNYYTFPYTDTTTDREDELLFEIIIDFITFGVLSRFTKASLFIPAAYRSNKNILHDFGVPADKVYSQIEGIFFIDKRNKLELFCVIIDIDYDGLISGYTKSKSKILKEKLLKNALGEHWEEIKVYIKENKLKTKMKPDLLRVLDHYDTLAKGNN